MSFFRVPARFGRAISFVDVLLVIGLLALVYAMIGVAQEWASPFRPKTEIDLGFWALVRYSFFSLVRVTVAYLLSLVFTLFYGYAAAKSKRWEGVLIALLDILQSVPVLGFMPGLVLALVNLFPHSNLGLEIAAIVMIFTGQGWNMTFSFYASVKGVPEELREMTRLFRMNRLDVLRTVELPISMNGLLWNSMLGMAGGWFFLMVIESFTLGDRDFRLPGIGSYMAVAYERHDTFAILAGIVAMFVLIVLVDRCVWAPLVVWSERFKYDRDAHDEGARSIVLEWLNRSHFPEMYERISKKIRKGWAKRVDAEKREKRPPRLQPEQLKILAAGAWWLFLVLGILVVLYGLKSMYHLVAATTPLTWLIHFRDTLYTLVRVMVATFVGAVITVPIGVFIGLHPVWTRRLEPVVQIVASFPAPMLFPLITAVFLKCGMTLSYGSVILMIFSSQWYILFNVISGASLIPHQLIDVARIFNVRGVAYWKAIILPAIFPSLTNGLITAAGGAWNACIVSEIVQYGGQNLATTGIGASITKAAQAGDYPALAGAVLMMVTTVVVLNRLFWGILYRLAETRFKLE